MKKQNMIKYMTVITVTGALLISAGCGEKKTTAVAVETPAEFISQAPTGEAVPIPEARNAKPGEKVLVKGMVMGWKKPFVEGRAAFILGDRATLTPCNENPDDHCPTPWDVCCDPAPMKLKGTVTIQLVDDAGKVRKYGLKGVNGIKELSWVTVAGIVAPTSSEEAFIINASEIYVKP